MFGKEVDVSNKRHIKAMGVMIVQVLLQQMVITLMAIGCKRKDKPDSTDRAGDSNFGPPEPTCL
jgi:hypothetical protein